MTSTVWLIGISSLLLPLAVLETCGFQPVRSTLAFPCALFNPTQPSTPIHHLFTILNISLAMYFGSRSLPTLFSSWNDRHYLSRFYLLSAFFFSKQSSSPWALLFPAFVARTAYASMLVVILELHAWLAALFNVSCSRFVSR